MRGVGEGCNPLNPFPGSARVLYLFYMEIGLHSKHICFRDIDTGILFVSTFAGLLCNSVIPKVRHSVKPEMASTCPLKSNTFESKERFRVRFFKKIQDWILKSVRIRKWILRFFSEQINPRSLGSWCIKGTEESTLGVDSSVPLRDRNPKDLGLICSVKKRKIHFQILTDLRIQSWIF